MLKRTRAINKILKLRKPINGIQGGTSAGKTIGIIAKEIDYAIKFPYTETSVVAESIPHLKRGALRDFKKIMKQTNRWFPHRWHDGDKRYTFHNGSWIEFFGADDDSKLRGARRTRLFMNEANKMTFKVYTELASRTSGEVTMDWNPTNRFWFHDELLDDEDVGFLILTYKDNHMIPDRSLAFIKKAIEKANAGSNYWKNWVTVYVDGQLGKLEGTVFEDWEIIDVLPTEARLLCYGLDFGYSNDNTAIVAVYKWNKKIILHEIAYSIGLLNSDIADILKMNKRATVWADSAEPKSIKEIKLKGIDIRGVKKGRDSINYGINIMHQQDIMVTKSSVNIIKEYNNYLWQKNKDGSKINKPEDKNNDAMDASRYGVVSSVGGKSTFVSARAS